VIAILLTLLVVTIALLALYTGFGFRLRFKPSRSKLFVGLTTYFVSFATVAAVSFLLVMFIAGPHSGVLEPGIYSQITFLTGLSTVLIVPVLAVYATLRRSGNRSHAT
jgi:hypothetical protein